MKFFSFALAAAALIATAGAAQAEVKSIVLVHGAFADGSGWKPVAKILERDGYTVQVVQEPETSLKDDVAATKIILDKAGPCVLVGHSYGGTVITAVADRVPKKLAYLIYLDGFVPEDGKSQADYHGPEITATIIERARLPPGFRPGITLRRKAERFSMIWRTSGSKLI